MSCYFLLSSFFMGVRLLCEDSMTEKRVIQSVTGYRIELISRNGFLNELIRRKTKIFNF